MIGVSHRPNPAALLPAVPGRTGRPGVPATSEQLRALLQLFIPDWETLYGVRSELVLMTPPDSTPRPGVRETVLRHHDSQTTREEPIGSIEYVQNALAGIAALDALTRFRACVETWRLRFSGLTRSQDRWGRLIQGREYRWRGYRSLEISDPGESFLFPRGVFYSKE